MVRLLREPVRYGRDQRILLFLARRWPTLSRGSVSLDGGGLFTRSRFELITDVKKLRGTKTLIKDFGLIADLLGERMGCLLFQFPPSYRFTRARLTALHGQLDPSRRNVVEFRHASWWNEIVYDAFVQTGTIFCSCSGPRLPNILIKTADTVYVRLHGPERWYRHDYSKSGADGVGRANTPQRCGERIHLFQQ
jgi:hypothetical protein